jgi:hypothetical protein
MGYRLAIMPGLLVKTVYGICDEVLAQTRSLGRHSVPPGDINVRDAFRRVGADEWDQISLKFGAASDQPAR